MNWNPLTPTSFLQVKQNPSQMYTKFYQFVNYYLSRTQPAGKGSFGINKSTAPGLPYTVFRMSQDVYTSNSQFTNSVSLIDSEHHRIDFDLFVCPCLKIYMVFSKPIDEETYDLSNVPGSNGYIYSGITESALFLVYGKQNMTIGGAQLPKKTQQNLHHISHLKYCYLYIKYQDVTYFELFKTRLLLIVMVEI